MVTLAWNHLSAAWKKYIEATEEKETESATLILSDFPCWPLSVASVTQGLINALIYYKLAGSMEQCHFGMSRLIKRGSPTSRCTATQCHLLLGRFPGQILLNIAVFFQDNS